MLPICSCSLRVRDDDDVDLLLVAVVFVVVVVVVVALVSVTVVPAVAVVVVFFAGWWYSGHCCRGAIRPGRGGCPKFWREELKVDALARTTTPATHSQPSEDATRSGGIELRTRRRRQRLLLDSRSLDQTHCGTNSNPFVLFSEPRTLKP